MATENASGGAKRGFAAMSPEKQREIASKGGKTSHGGGRKSSRLS
jgi:general stress protein YciG